ncbi:MAG: hypothetical protein ACYTBV_17905, partial [Planctomycetota bacterium]
MFFHLSQQVQTARKNFGLDWILIEEGDDFLQGIGDYMLKGFHNLNPPLIVTLEALCMELSVNR